MDIVEVIEEIRDTATDDDDDGGEKDGSNED